MDMDLKAIFIVTSVMFMVFTVLAPSSGQNHPLSEIYPIDEDLNMSNQRIINASKISVNDGVGATGLVLEGFNISDSGESQFLTLDYSNSEWDIVNSDLDLRGNSIKGFFSSGCQSGFTAVDIQDTGNIQCVNISSTVQDDYVNRGGDSMKGNLDLNGNNLTSTGGEVCIGEYC